MDLLEKKSERNLPATRNLARKVNRATNPLGNYLLNYIIMMNRYIWVCQDAPPLENIRQVEEGTAILVIDGQLLIVSSIIDFLQLFKLLPVFQSCCNHLDAPS